MGHTGVSRSVAIPGDVTPAPVNLDTHWMMMVCHAMVCINQHEISVLAYSIFSMKPTSRNMQGSFISGGDYLYWQCVT